MAEIITNQEQGGSTAPRSISPHKGGRTERFYGRCTPEVKRKLEEIKRRTGETAADLFEEIVQLKHNELTQYNKPMQRKA